MAGRWFFQRGHVSIVSADTAASANGSTRWVLSAALVAAVAVLVLFSSCVAREASSETDPLSNLLFDRMSLSADKGTDGSMPSTALTSLQHATVAAVSAPPSSGLLHQSLSDEGFAQVAPLIGQAEARLITIYSLISQGHHREALIQADQLVQDHPNFHLAHLVRGDLLSMQMRPVRHLGDVPDTKARAAAQQLSVLRDESRRRLQALTERPPEGSVPTQFLSLSSQSRHAIAVDASRSRLYLFENRTPSASGSQIAPPPQLKLIGDFYISVGLSGIEKTMEGDKRTPLGVYYITSNLNPDNLPDLYGVGALPINYPNPLDVQRGKTGSGIWLHGTPSEQFVRAPLASDGCVVLSNPDLETLLGTVQIRTTPVVIATKLNWVHPADLDTERRAFEQALESWRTAKSEGQIEQLRSLYSPRFRGAGKTSFQEGARRQAEPRNERVQRPLQLKDVSLLRWQDSEDTMVVTFGEVTQGQIRGVTRRQYWARENDQWKIFFEGTP